MKYKITKDGFIDVCRVSLALTMIGYGAIKLKNFANSEEYRSLARSMKGQEGLVADPIPNAHKIILPKENSSNIIYAKNLEDGINQLEKISKKKLNF